MRALAVATLLALAQSKSIFAWTKQKPRIPALVLTYDDRRPLGLPGGQTLISAIFRES